MNDQNLLQDLLAQAVELITSQSIQADFPEADQTQISVLAEQGDSQQIGDIIKSLKSELKNSDIRKALHYFAESEAERGLKLAGGTSFKDIKKAFDNIAEAFKLANKIDLAIENK